MYRIINPAHGNSLKADRFHAFLCRMALAQYYPYPPYPPPPPPRPYYYGDGPPQRYYPPSPRWQTWNGCAPNFTVQDGLCKPYRSY
jgi:hypothetical protein